MPAPFPCQSLSWCFLCWCQCMGHRETPLYSHIYKTQKQGLELMSYGWITSRWKINACILILPHSSSLLETNSWDLVIKCTQWTIFMTQTWVGSSFFCPSIAMFLLPHRELYIFQKHRLQLRLGFPEFRAWGRILTL